MTGYEHQIQRTKYLHLDNVTVKLPPESHDAGSLRNGIIEKLNFSPAATDDLISKLVARDLDFVVLEMDPVQRVANQARRSQISIGDFPSKEDKVFRYRHTLS